MKITVSVEFTIEVDLPSGIARPDKELMKVAEDAVENTLGYMTSVHEDIEDNILDELGIDECPSVCVSHEVDKVYVN